MSKGKRWALSACALMLILLGLRAASAAEGRPETVTGYFVDHVYMRPSMTKTLDYVDVFPPYTIVTLEVVDDIWAVYTSPNNKTGYVKYDRILPVPEYEKETPYSVYSEKRIRAAWAAAGFEPRLIFAPDLDTQIFWVELNKGLAIANANHVMANGSAVVCARLRELPPENLVLAWNESNGNPLLRVFLEECRRQGLNGK